MKKYISYIIAVIFIFSAVEQLTARPERSGDMEDQYYSDAKYDEDMESISSSRHLLKNGPQYGVWLTPLFIYKKSGSDSLASFMNTTRIWGKTYLWPHSYLYVRGKHVFLGTLHKTGYASGRTYNLVDLDVGFIRIATPKKSLNLYVGRKFFLLGSGLLFNGRGDGAEVVLNTPFVNIQAFGNYTGFIQKEDNPYGLSDKDISNGAKRYFFGGSVGFEFFNQELYAMTLVQKDNGNQFPYQKTRYNSEYYGVGLKGILFASMFYYAEVIHQRGKSYISGTFYKGKIRAYAAVGGLKYYLKMALNPVIMAQYAYGSGDKDRDDYKNPTGNSFGEDNGFIYFGTFVAGYGLRPQLSNLHVIRGGFAVSPFSWSDNNLIRSMTIISKYSFYLKDKNNTPINSGYDATQNQRFVGQGLDFSFRWLIISDVSMFVNYALFIPGDAYATSTKKHFLMGGCNISF